MSDNAKNAGNQQERSRMRNKFLTPDYIVGLVDGEGYFSVIPDIRQYPTYRTTEVKLVFGVAIKESDGKILQQLQNYFGCGKIRRRIDKRPNFCNMVNYQVRNQDEIFGVIVPFFLRHRLKIRSKKNDFMVFARIAGMVRKKRHLTPNGLNRIRRLMTRMHQRNPQRLHAKPQLRRIG